MAEYDPITGEEIDPLTGKPPKPPLSERNEVYWNKKLNALGRAREERLTRTGTPTVSMKASEIHGGVSVMWLAEVFNLDPKTVRKRLGECPPLGHSPQGPRYALSQAAAYLIKPVFDVNKYLKTMRPEELPPQLQVGYWDARLKRLKVEEMSGDLWRTEQVRSVFAELFMTMKSAMQLWTEDIERTVGLSAEQRANLVAQVDALQEEMHGILIEGKLGEHVRSARAEIEDEEFFLDDDGKDLV